YPVILVFACTLVMLLITKYVIPQVREMFEKGDIEIPMITKRLFALSDVFAVVWWWPFVIAIVLVVVYRLFISRNPLARRWVDTIKLRIPILGPIVKGGA